MKSELMPAAREEEQALLSLQAKSEESMNEEMSY
jgi:hypothetical protein